MSGDVLNNCNDQNKENEDPKLVLQSIQDSNGLRGQIFLNDKFDTFCK